LRMRRRNWCKKNNNCMMTCKKYEH
jgi:hypothetical protein